MERQYSKFYWKSEVVDFKTLLDFLELLNTQTFLYGQLPLFIEFHYVKLNTSLKIQTLN